MTVRLIATIDSSEALRVLRAAHPDAPNRVAHRALMRAALLIQEDATRNQIQRGGSGPPNPPPGPLISRTGTLRRSIRVDDVGLPRFVDVGSDLVYAGVHELGGQATRTPARPFLQPAADKIAPQLARIFEAEWNCDIEGAR